MKSAAKTLSESIVVGLILIIFIYIASFILHVGGYPMIATPDECKKWNNTYIMEASVFLAGMLFHLMAEATGVNEWYARNYFVK
jgi:hypothetical protein